MIYTNDYESPLGNILLAGDEQGLTGLWFTEGGRYIGLGLGLRKAADILGLVLKKEPAGAKRTILTRRKNGWIFISQAAIRAFSLESIW